MIIQSHLLIMIKQDHKEKWPFGAVACFGRQHLWIFSLAKNNGNNILSKYAIKSTGKTSLFEFSTFTTGLFVTENSIA